MKLAAISRSEMARRTLKTIQHRGQQPRSQRQRHDHPTPFGHTPPTEMLQAVAEATRRVEKAEIDRNADNGWQKQNAGQSREPPLSLGQSSYHAIAWLGPNTLRR